jgi:hypothetical protein
VLINRAETLTLKLHDVIAAARLDLSEAESQELEELLTEYWDIFEMKSGDCGRNNSVYHQIDNGMGPTHSPFLVSQTEVGKKLKNMEQHGSSES